MASGGSEIVAALRRQRIDSFIADGEIVTFKDGITSFAKLQERMKVARPSETLIRSVPVWLYLFDLLYLDHYDIRQVPLRYLFGPTGLHPDFDCNFASWITS
jgi:bifunctional non-homologous end joining protein LigD